MSRRMKFDVRQHGRKLVTTIVIWAVVLVAWHMTLVRPKVKEYRDLTDRSGPQLRQLQQQMDEVEEREAFVQALDQAKSDLAYLREEVLSTREKRMIDVERELAELCVRFGIDLNTVNFDNDLLPDAGLDKVVMVVPLEGNYANLRRFLQAVESSDKFILVEKVTLDEGREGGVQLQLSVTLASYFELEQGPLPGRAANGPRDRRA